MNPKLTHLLGMATSASALLLAGCINHEATVYRDVNRKPVEFENDTAARIFYETLANMPSCPGTESRTEVSLPIVFKAKTHVIPGKNAAFNEAVALCDTNKDGRITENEAKIFAALRGKS